MIKLTGTKLYTFSTSFYFAVLNLLSEEDCAKCIKFCTSYVKLQLCSVIY